MRGSGEFMNVLVQEHHALNQTFDVAKSTIRTPLSSLSSCRLSFPIVGLKISSLPNFAFKSPNFHMVLRKMIKNLL